MSLFFNRRLFSAVAAIALAVFCATVAAEAATPKETPKMGVGIAAVVNDDIITFSDIENRLKLYVLSAGREPPENVRQQMLQQAFARLVDEKLQMQEARALGIVVSPGELEHAFGSVAGQNNTTAEVFRKNLQSVGVNPATIEDQIRAEISWTQVVRRKLRPQVNISEGEIDTEVGRRQRSSGKQEYRVAEIFLSFDGKASEAVALEKAQALAEEIRKGKQFSLLARQFSEAPGAATGGDLGWIEQGILSKPLEDALVALKPGQLSNPVRTDKGYHLLFLRDSRLKGNIPAGALSAAAAKTQGTTESQKEASEAKEEKSEPAPVVENRPSLVTTTDAPPPAPDVENTPARLTLKRIMLPVAANEAKIITQTKLSRAETLRREISSCAAMDTRMKDFSAAGTGDLGPIMANELPPALQNAVQDLPDGVLSKPVQDAQGISLVMVCGREGGTAALPIISGTPVAQNTTETTPEANAPETAAAETETGAAGPAPAAAAASANPAEQFRENVANEMGMQRLEQMADRYLRDLRATAYIDKRF